MRTWSQTLAWILVAAVAAILVVQLFPRLYPFCPEDWTVGRDEAAEIALRSFEKLGKPVEDPYVVVELDSSVVEEKRLRLKVGEAGLQRFRESPLADRLLYWTVTVYEPGARPGSWTYRARVTPRGDLAMLRLRVAPDEEGGAVDTREARRQAEELLLGSGFSLEQFEEPTERRVDHAARTDLSLFFRERERLLGDDVPYGVEVSFAGEKLAGFEPWMEDPAQEEIIGRTRLNTLMSNVWIFSPYLIFPFVAVPFLRRYHAGEIGVRRATHVFLVAFVAASAVIVLGAKGTTEGASWGALSRALIPFPWSFQIIMLWASPVALVAAVSWSVGEARCREKWGTKLAAFDAVFQRRFANATVARSSLRGLTLGAVLAAAMLLALAAAARFGAWSETATLFGPWWDQSAVPGLALALFILPLRLVANLFTLLFFLPWAVRRIGLWGGGLGAVVLATLLFWPPMLTDPAALFLLFGALQAAFLVVVFLRYDLLTALLASVASALFITGMPFLLSGVTAFRIQAALPLLAVATPLLLSFRHLRGGQKFQYRYDDVPAHVRRIAERERQRVELETAREIQTSILPELPPQLAGIQLAHCYLPASEVGGDFYDVLALDENRLAVAVGDVAGHGVSSGLVMSMAKSTLALQVTVDPDVETVLSTMNRMVYRSARLRLLTTLCYAVVDRAHHELTYASAGHLAPMVLNAEGQVESLRSESYPLGVREAIAVELHTRRLRAGDRIFLYSDGIVEARRQGSDELFGFDRLTESLEQNAGLDPAGLRDAVLRDVREFVGSDFREDDQTVLVLQVP